MSDRNRADVSRRAMESRGRAVRAITEAGDYQQELRTIKSIADTAIAGGYSEIGALLEISNRIRSVLRRHEVEHHA